MKYLWTTIKVSDLDKSKTFYKDILGLEIDWEKGDSKEFGIVMFKTGDSNLELLFAPDMDGTIGKGVTVGFEVESLEEIRKKLQDHGYDLGKEQSPMEGMVFAFTHDPDGVGVQLVEYNK